MHENNIQSHSNYDYSAIAKVATPYASLYLTRLCKHFSHKVLVNVNVEQQAACIDFSIGFCHININADVLILYCTSNDKNDLNDIIKTMARHLEQFASKEALSLCWKINTL